MVTSAADIKAIIVDEVGDTPDKVLTARIDLYWDSFADKAAIHPRLQEWYTTKRCIDAVLGRLRNQVTFSTDGSLSLQLSNRIAYLKDRKAEVQTEIDKLERIARANRPSVVAPLANTTLDTPPMTFPAGPPDASSPLFQGNPYLPNAGTGGDPF